MNRVSGLPRFILLLCSVLNLLSACGGGGADSGTSTATTSSASSAISTSSSSISAASSSRTSSATSSSSAATSSTAASSSSSLTAYANCTYSTATSLSMGVRTANVLAVDLNQDHVLDIVGISQGSGTIGVALGTSTGSFGTVATYSTSTVGPYEAVAVDLNGDGYPDIAAANFGASSGAPYGTTVSVFINKGDGTFNSYVDYSASDSNTDKLRGITSGDFNQDGYLDLAIAAQGTGLHILLGKGDGTLQYTGVL